MPDFGQNQENSIEILQNKTIKAESQTNLGRFVTAPYIKESGSLYAAPSGPILTELLQGFTLLGTPVLQTVDSSHGLSVNYATSTSNNNPAGYKSPVLFTYRQFNPYFRLKFNLVSTTLARLFVGFSSNNTTIASETLIAAADQGAMFGFQNANANYNIYTNDGSAAALATGLTPVVAKDTGIRAVEMWFDSAGFNVNLTGITGAVASALVTTRLPAANTPLSLFFFYETATTAANNWKLYNGYFEHTRTVSPL